MLVRPSRLTVLAAGALLSSVLTGCGFNYQTDRVNTISAGVNDRDGVVDVLGAVVIANQDGSGVFAATFVNKNREEPATFEGLEPGEQVAPAGEGEPLEIPTAGRASLFNEDAVPVSGDFVAGDFVEVTLRFDNGQTSTLEIPVVVPCRQYSPEVVPGLSLPPVSTPLDPGTGTEPPTEPTESTEGSTESGSAEPSEDTTEELSETEGELPDRYSCEAAPEVDPRADSGGEPEETEESG